MFEQVTQFEKLIASFFDAPYCVAVDSCTHALELALHQSPADYVSCPTNTYLSVPMMLERSGQDWFFQHRPWKGYYHLTPNVIDAATLWQAGAYIPETYMCISFHYKKHLSIGRAGAILCPSEGDYQDLKKLSYDGRDLSIVPWEEDGVIRDRPIYYWISLLYYSRNCTTRH